MMEWFLAAIAVILAGGLASLAAGRRPRLASFLGAAGAVLGGGGILALAVMVLLRGETLSLDMPWSVPMGSFHVAIDPLSALFAAVIALVVALAAVYGSSYLQSYADRKNLGSAWFFYNLLAASMLMVVVARNGVLFLVSWELMSLASFFLVMFEAEHESVRRAGWTYLTAMHLGAAFLLAMFLLLGRDVPSLDFDRFTVATGTSAVSLADGTIIERVPLALPVRGSPDPKALAEPVAPKTNLRYDALTARHYTSGIIFLLAVIGFGTKAGFVPLHVWLPEAHPAAPSHVSAVMSGVMLKTGIYGLLRTLTWLGPPEPWWGWTLVGIGAVSGILGILWAIAQSDLKRLLAYSSVENVGIITLGIGVGLLGLSYDCPVMAVLGFAGALLHVVNHAVFKSLLFLGAGAVLHATGTRDIDRLGGLLKRMPGTGAAVLVGATAICGLPPLNGFVSEFLIYLGVAAGLIGGTGNAAATWATLSLSVIGSLVLIGGLAAVCFTKVFGVAFLGEPRSPEAAVAHEAGSAMRWPMTVLAGTCIVIGLAAPVCPIVLRSAVATLTNGLTDEQITASLGQATSPLLAIAFGAYILLGLILLFVQIRRRLLAGRRVEQAVTWDCGYVSPTPRMQYTASSFARPLVMFLRVLIGSKETAEPPRGLFPSHARLRTHTPDAFRQRLYQPIFLGVAWLASKSRWLQRGHIQLYVLYIALTILALMLWKLG